MNELNFYSINQGLHRERRRRLAIDAALNRISRRFTTSARRRQRARIYVISSTIGTLLGLGLAWLATR